MAKKQRPQISKENPVPLYRSYGVIKKEGFFAWLNNRIASVIAAVLIVMLGILWILGIYIFVNMLGAIGIMLAIISVILFVYFKLCRKLRKRLKFIIRLKKQCRRLGYTVSFCRGFFKGLRLNFEGFDFTVDTGKKLWCVRFFTPKKYLSHVIFLSEDRIRIKKNITKSHFKFIWGFNSPKISEFDYSFKDEMPQTDGERTARALIINPVPHDVFKKDSDGAIIPIGTGYQMYGYRLFTGSGFLTTLLREDEEN